MRFRLLPAFALGLLAPGAALANGPGDFAAPAGLSGFERPARMVRATDMNRVVDRVPRVAAQASALANSVTVQQSGRGNTLILNIEQVNSGTVSANALNGRLALD